jgi:hypothetical protein
VPLTELPFGFPGRVFRSPMPFGPYDLHSEVYDRFCEEQIRIIVLLASDEECLHKTGCNLRALYLKEGFQVLYLPIPDFGVPTHRRPGTGSPKDDCLRTGRAPYCDSLLSGYWAYWTLHGISGETVPGSFWC